jgi:hypothetical protein
MILNYDKPNVEAAKLLDEHFFSIEDTSMIFDILRNKLYSNPILAVCREITCNARDAHREAGTPNLPIHIYLPNHNEAFYKVADIGTGISPDRMLNIFIKYTASTKRGDNIQVGAWGIGAKSPFSVSNSFNVLTNYNGTHYNYQCFIDETKVGKLILLDEYPTNEPNGTEIVIPVKPSDFHLFEIHTEEATRHWDIKPIIKGGQIEYKPINKILEGKNWTIVEPNGYNYRYNREIKIIIDGIEYPLKLEALKAHIDSDFIESITGNLYVYFNTGELSLSANREQLYLDKATQNLLKQRLDEFIFEIKDAINIKINKYSNYWDANVFFNKKIKSLFESKNDILDQVRWNGLKLLNDNFNTERELRFNVSVFKKIPARAYYHNDVDTKIKHVSGQGLNFDTNSLLVINDLEIIDITSRHVKKFFEDNAKLKSINIINLNENVNEALLNDRINLHLMNPRRLSEVTKVSKRISVSTSARLTIFKFNHASSTFDRTSYSAIDEDKSTKVLCMISKDYQGKSILFKNKKRFPANTLKIFSNLYPGISFYGIDESVSEEKIDKYFSDFQDLDDFLDEKISSFNENYFLECKLACDQRHYIDNTLFKYKEEFNFLIKNPTSFFLKRVDYNNQVNELLQSNNQSLLYIYESIYNEITAEDIENYLQKKPQLNLQKITEEFNEKYPLFKFISSANSYKFGENIRHIAQYINLIDADGISK